MNTGRSYAMAGAESDPKVGPVEQARICSIDLASVVLESPEPSVTMHGPWELCGLASKDGVTPVAWDCGVAACSSCEDRSTACFCGCPPRCSSTHTAAMGTTLQRPPMWHEEVTEASSEAGAAEGPYLGQGMGQDRLWPQ